MSVMAYCYLLFQPVAKTDLSLHFKGCPIDEAMTWSRETPERQEKIYNYYAFPRRTCGRWDRLSCLTPECREMSVG